MTSQERIRIGEIWVGMAQVYGKEIKDAALTIMLDAVSDLPFEAVLGALRDWPRVSKQQRHPFPAEVREMAGGGVSADSEATIAASRIQQGIKEFGYMRGSEAKLFVGSLAWEVIRTFGGWQNVCKEHGVSLEPGVFFAQALKIAKSKAEYARAGRHNEAPQLPSPKTKPGLSSVREITGLLPERPEGV